MNLYILNINYNCENWFLNQEEHRTNGPSTVFNDGGKYWYQNGEFHRDDGPAIIYSDGDKYWYLNDRNYTEEDYLKEIKKQRAKHKESCEQNESIHTKYKLLKHLEKNMVGFK